MADIAETVDDFFCLGLGGLPIQAERVDRERIDAYNLGLQVNTRWADMLRVRRNYTDASLDGYLGSLRSAAEYSSDELAEGRGALPILDNPQRDRAESDYGSMRREVRSYLNALLTHEVQKETFPSGFERIEKMLQELGPG